MPSRKSGAAMGRPRDRRLAQDLAVLEGLSDESSAVVPAEACDLLGMDEARLAEILAMVGAENVSGSADEPLPPMAALYSLDDTGAMARLSAAGQACVPPLRLTEAQARAVERAFDRLGVAVEDELRQRVANALYPVGMDAAATATEPLDADGVAGALSCAQSLAQARLVQDGTGTGAPTLVEQPVVTFSYQGSNDTFARTRRVCPRRLRVDGGLWHVDAFDVDAHGARTFVAGRMCDPVCTTERMAVPLDPAEAPEGGSITLRCRGRARAAVQAWPECHVERQDADELVVSVPYYRGDWLPRHVLALGSLVSHDSAELAQAMAEIAAEDLALYRSRAERQDSM